MRNDPTTVCAPSDEHGKRESSRRSKGQGRSENCARATADYEVTRNTGPEAGVGRPHLRGGERRCRNNQTDLLMRIR